MPARDTDRPRAAPAPVASVGRARPEGGAPTPGSSRRAPRPGPAQPARRRGQPGRWGVLWRTGRLAALVLAIACAGGLVYLLTARALTVRTLTIVGASATSEGELAAGVAVMGNNIFTVEPQAAAERLTALPTVREATVWGELPDRLVIRIAERQPALAWQLGPDRLLIDERGVVMAIEPPDGRGRDLPTAIVRDVEPPTVGGRVDATVVAKLLLIFRSAPDYGLPIAALDYSPQGGFVLHIDADRRLLLGAGTRLEEQLAVGAAVAASDSSWTTIDVSDPDRPFLPAR